MWWTADKLAYRNEDNFIRAFWGDELVWEKNVNKIFYTSTDGQIVVPYRDGRGQSGDDYTAAFGANIVSNVYQNGVGVITFDDKINFVNYGFYGKDKLETITLPNTVQYIGPEAFDGCVNLISINIPILCHSIYTNSFLNCTSLTSMDLSNSRVREIYRSAFEGCTGLTSVSFPSTLRTIQTSAFRGCTGLTSIFIPENVYDVNSQAFMGCSNLASISVDSNNSVYDSRNNCNAIIETATNVLVVGCKNTVIPSSVTEIGGSAFMDMTGLTSIVIPSSVTEIGSQAFSGCTSLSSVTIPSSVTEIGATAFLNTDLTSVTIPSSVTNIGFQAFCNCRRLYEVIVNCQTPPTLGSSVFDNNASGRLIKVPANKVSTYQGANGWSTYASSIVAQ